MTKELVTINEIKEMAKISFASKLFQMPNVESMATLMMLCQSEGIHPLQALKRYHIIKGRPTMRADAMLAEFQRAGGSIKWTTRTDKACKATFSHELGGTLEVEWTIDMAKKAQLTSNPTWGKYPRQMLSARVISEGVRTVYPAIVTGIYTPEEVEDFDTKPVKPATKKQPVTRPEPVVKAEPTITDAEVVPDKPKVNPTPVEQKAIEAEEVFGGNAKPTGKVVADQLKKIRELCVKIGCSSRDDMRLMVGNLAGREIKSATDLTAVERGNVILALMKEAK